MERTRNRGKFGRPGALFPNKIDQGRQNALYRFSDFIRREELHLLFTLKSTCERYVGQERRESRFRNVEETSAKDHSFYSWVFIPTVCFRRMML